MTSPGPHLSPDAIVTRTRGLLDAGGVTPDPYGLVPAVVTRQDDAWTLGQHPRRTRPLDES